MYKLFTDKSELFECDIKLEGASLSKSKARLVVETQDYSLLFQGSIITAATTGDSTASIQNHNETGAAIPDDTGFTASFVVL